VAASRHADTPNPGEPVTTEQQLHTPLPWTRTFLLAARPGAEHADAKTGGLPDRSRTRHELGRTISADENLRLFSGAFTKRFKAADLRR
jgi:hypothetical protein